MRRLNRKSSPSWLPNWLNTRPLPAAVDSALLRFTPLNTLMDTSCEFIT